jgi:1-deoxy-D-xylulose-5-phosphate synthase
VAPVELGRAEIVRSGDDGAIFCCGALLADCVQAAEQLRSHGLEVGVVNARFVKPLDADTLLPLVASCPWVLTVEEAALAGGFGSAVAEAACDAGIDSGRVRRLGIPDRFIEHAERGELLSDLGLDTAGIVRTCLALAARWSNGGAAPRPAEAIQRRVS